VTDKRNYRSCSRGYSHCNNGGAHDNKHIITEILALRSERAKLLGYPTHPVDFKTLFGSFHEWPLRDPMTMQPLAPQK